MGTDERGRPDVLAAAVRGRSARGLNAGDTIFALSSGALPAAIAVMRLSGPSAGTVLSTLAGRRPPPRRASLRTLRTRDGDELDRALILWLPGPLTATGEDMVELHLHGGRATVAAVDAALRQEGLRPAGGGEFTRRALEHGRIDLPQAEGLADLLAAETETERRLALATTEGALSRALNGWCGKLAQLAAMVEMRLDHDEEDDAVERRTINEAIAALREEMATVLQRPTVQRVRNGPTIVLAGPPNAGKSSLFNALLERDAAIVTATPGTTRDLLDASLMRRGRPYRLLDTAGLHDTDDEVERIGIERAQVAAARADLTLWLGDTAPAQQSALWVNARADLPGRTERAGTVISVSVRKASTIAELWSMIEAATSIAAVPDGVHFSQRQYDSVSIIVDRLASAEKEKDELLVAEHVRSSMSELCQILGQSAPEAVLNELFSRFCIGK